MWLVCDRKRAKPEVPMDKTTPRRVYRDTSHSRSPLSHSGSQPWGGGVPLGSCALRSTGYMSRVITRTRYNYSQCMAGLDDEKLSRVTAVSVDAGLDCGCQAFPLGAIFRYVECAGPLRQEVIRKAPSLSQFNGHSNKYILVHNTSGGNKLTRHTSQWVGAAYLCDSGDTPLPANKRENGRNITCRRTRPCRRKQRMPSCIFTAAIRTPHTEA